MLTNAQVPQSPPKTKTAFKNPLLYSSLLVGIVILVVAWIFFSRWQRNLSIEPRLREEDSRKQFENDRVALEHVCGNELAIQSFYAIAVGIHKGDSVQL